MHSSPSTAWTVESLARKAGMSRTAFAIKFGQRVGITPLNYLTHWHMQETRRLLRETRDSIRAVAEQTGYGSEPTFTRAFKKWLEITPAAYRRQAS